MAKKKSKTKGVKYWKKKAWDEFSKFIRVRDALRTTGTVCKAVCCSCGRIYPAFGVGCLQAGHLIPGRSNSILFNELGVHGQCYNCNVRLKGNWPPYHDFMVNHYTLEAVTMLLTYNKTIFKFQPHVLEEMRDTYKAATKIMLESRELLKGETYEAYRNNLCDFDAVSNRLSWVLRGTAGGRDTLFETGHQS